MQEFVIDYLQCIEDDFQAKVLPDGKSDIIVNSRKTEMKVFYGDEKYFIDLKKSIEKRLDNLSDKYSCSIVRIRVKIDVNLMYKEYRIRVTELTTEM
ncbi:MAG: hypothetical protein EOO06_00420 [Chitinophagaceae bacterium]|nr:MAG: hypothetical protein EOO06_00420 [Chitinophagaceae bacterium]